MSKNMAVMNGNRVENIIVCHDYELETENLITYTEDNPAYINGDYVDGFFYPPQPYPSWSRLNGTWIPPVKRPFPGVYQWNEEQQEWQEIN